MRKSTEIVLWVIALVVPAVLLTVGILILRKQTPSPPPAPDGSPFGAIVPGSAQAVSCGASAVTCSLTAPNACTDCGDGWTCQRVDANDTDYGVDGTFCLPTKPASACTQTPVDSNERMPGVWRWTGWAGVNVQGWECACPSPRFYPMDTGGGTSAGACKKSAALCVGGDWTYPCRRSESDPSVCDPLSDEQRDALLGSDVMQNGLCRCHEGDRLSMDTSTGLPVCVPDTCDAVPRCSADSPCPGGAACMRGRCVRASSTCDEDVDCGKSGECTSGVCTWGRWRAYPGLGVFGECDCPESCASVGSLCSC